MSQRWHVDVPGGPIEVDDDGVRAGDAADRVTAVVWLHEGLGSIDLWRGVPDDVAAAASSRLRTVVYSRHGYGRSAAARLPRPVEYMHHEADVVLPALLEQLDIERPILVGHSDGASIALLYAGASRPVAGVVSLAPHVFVEPESTAGVAAAGRQFADTDMVERMGRHHDDPAATFSGWHDVWASDAFRSWNIEDRLGGIDAPLLVIQGLDDRYGTVRQVDAIADGAAVEVERLELAGVGHAPHLEQRERVVAAIATFIDRCATRSSERT